VEYLFDGAVGSSGNVHQSIAIELQQMWRDTLGINLELRQVETQVFWGMQSRLDYTLARSSWIGDYNDANTFLGMFVTGDGNNETGWSNATYDHLVHTANETTDLKKREQMFQQAETILVRQGLPIIPLYFYLGVNYFDTNKVQGIWQNVLDDHPLRCLRKIKPRP
jgi:oligopeptide transport system substrate-binding protein